MNSRQSLLVALFPTALVVAFLLGRYTAPSGAPAGAPAGEAGAAPMSSQPAAFAPAQPAAGTGEAPGAANAPAAMAAGGGEAPYAGGQKAPGGDVSPEAPLSPTPGLDAKIAQAEKSGDKKAISAAYTERGSTRMYDERAGRRVKYRAALDDFRKAVAADPTNDTAKSAKETIESIYQSMHKEIPSSGA